MSKGSPIVCVRIPQEILDQVEDFLNRNADRSYDSPPNRSDYILDCIKERLGKSARAKKSAEKKKRLKSGGVIHPPQENENRLDYLD